MFYVLGFLDRAHEPKVGLTFWALVFVLGAMLRLATEWGNGVMILAGVIFVIGAGLHLALHFLGIDMTRDARR